jgi:predicted transcriptional regulator
MAQSQPINPAIRQVLKLVDQLSPDEREGLIHELQLQELRREVQKGVDSADRGELIPAEDVLEKLRKRAESRLNGE